MNTKPIVLLVVGLVVGGVLGYYLGLNNTPAAKEVLVNSEGNPAVSAEQKAETALPAEANPYAKIKDAANPFKDSSYQNPFAQ